MNYTTYWSVLDTPLDKVTPSGVCLTVAIVAGLLWLLIKKFKQNNGDHDKIILLWGTAIFSVLGFTFYILSTFVYKDDPRAKFIQVLNSPKTPRIEGTISNFQRTSRNGREIIETFTVDSIQFAYGDAALGKLVAFSQTNNYVIFNGQKVRVTYSYGSPYGENFKRILKLEIAK